MMAQSKSTETWKIINHQRRKSSCRALIEVPFKEREELYLSGVRTRNLRRNLFSSTTSPTRTQQIVIPKFEINRLKNLFNNFKTIKDFNNPDLIILKNNSLISRYANLDDKNYCEIKGYQILKIYLHKKIISCD